MHWLRRLSLVVAALLIVGALVIGFLPQPVPVELASVSRGPMQLTLTEEGRTRVIDRYQVSAPVAGYIRRVELNVGDDIEAGQALLSLEPLRSAVLDPRSRAEAEARVASATAALRVAEAGVTATKAEADLAALEYQRKKSLCDTGCISEEEKDIARTNWLRTKAQLRSARFAVEAAKADLEAARTALAHSAASDSQEMPETVVLRAPVAGRILQIHRESEGVVGAGEALIEIGDPQALEVIVDVLSADAVRIEPGTPVRLDRWGGAGHLEAMVRRIEPTGFTKTSALGVEEQRVWVVIDIRSPRESWQRLGDGYRVEAEFILWQADSVLQLPASALFRHDGGWAVFTIENDRARRSAVKIGHRNSLSAELLNGLEAEERVITHPSEAVHEGARVRSR